MTIFEQLQAKLDSKEKKNNVKGLAKFLKLNESKDLGNGKTSINADHFHYIEMNGEGIGKTISTVQAAGEGAAKFGDHIHNIMGGIVEVTDNHSHTVENGYVNGEQGIGYNDQPNGTRIYTVSSIGK